MFACLLFLVFAESSSQLRGAELGVAVNRLDEGEDEEEGEEEEERKEEERKEEGVELVQMSLSKANKKLNKTSTVELSTF